MQKLWRRSTASDSALQDMRWLSRVGVGTMRFLYRRAKSRLRNGHLFDNVLCLRKRLRWILILSLLSCGLAFIIVVAIFIGSSNISIGNVASILLSKIPGLGYLIPHTWQPHEEVIVVLLRLPRVLLAGLVGVALSLSGAAMQGIFKNPMADPYIIGISAGAGFGAVVAIVLGISVLSVYTIPFFAFLMALGTAFAVCKISFVGGRIPVDNLLLSGIAVGSFLSACTGFLIYRAGEKLHGVMFWLLGGLWGANWSAVTMMLLTVIASGTGIYLFARALNVFQLGEEEAQHVGIDVEKSKRWILIFSVLCTAVAVAFVGIVGFVGLIIPHIVRIFVGPDHRILLPACAVVGAIFLILADTAARSISPEDFPVGVVTAFFGAPFFIYLLSRRKRWRA